MKIQTILYIGLMAIAPAALAEEFSTGAPKPETLSEAVRFEKYKVTSAEEQARKDAGEQRKTASQSTARRKTETAKSSAERKTGQADATKK